MFLRNFFVALQFLTVFPAPRLRKFSAQDEEKAIFWYPTVGFIVGLITAVTFLLSTKIFIHVSRLPVVFAILTSFCITGALHIDGLADTADGLLSGQNNPKKKLAIMKDSRIGTMGVLAIVIFLMMKIEIMSLLPNNFIWKIFLLEPVLGKFAINIAMKRLPYVSINSKLLTRFKDVVPQWFFGLSAGAVFLIPCIVLSNYIGIIIGALLLAANEIFLRWIKKSVGGCTGDIYGAINELNGLFLSFFIYTFLKVAV